MTRTAVYAGSFDPLTNGHLSILREAARLFDQVYAVVAVNPVKSTLFTEAERVDLVRGAVADLPNVAVESTHGLVVELARQRGAGYLVRGIRGSIDLEYELALAQVNQALAPEISTVFLVAQADVSVVSSSFLKELARCGADASPYCPAEVNRRLRERYAGRS